MRFVKLTPNVPFTATGSKVIRINPEFIQSIAELPEGSEITFSNGKTLIVTESVEDIIGKQDDVSPMTEEEIERMQRMARELKERS